MTRIILIGYMGAGKTTVGKALSQSLALPFYDLDWYIEERYGPSPKYSRKTEKTDSARSNRKSCTR